MPLEVLHMQIRYEGDQILSYQDFIECKLGKNKLKSREELLVKVDWFQYCLIQNLFESDKNFGFREKNMELEEILIVMSRRSSLKIRSNF